MPKDLVHVRQPATRTGPAAQRGDVDFIDQVTKESRLGEDLDFQERRPGLKRYRRKLVQAVQPARRMDVVERHGENNAPCQPAREPRPVSPAPLTPATNHMITLVDRFQERLEMLFRPRFFRCGYQHERQCGSAKATFQCTANTFCSDRHDRRFDGPPKRTHQVRQGCADGFGGFRW